MRSVRTITTTALSTVLTVAIVGLLGSQLSTLPAAAAVAPSWQTAASYTALANVTAVSCAPSAAASSATCVAVGDDGGNAASIIVTQNGGSTWSDSTPPAGVTTLSSVSCPSTSVCYAGGGSGIMKSTNGGASWVIQDAAFPAESISCFNIDECTAVGGARSSRRPTGPPGIPRLHHQELRIPVRCLLPQRASRAWRSESVDNDPSIVGTENGATWTTLRPALRDIIVSALLLLGIDDLRRSRNCVRLVGLRALSTSDWWRTGSTDQLDADRITAELRSPARTRQPALPSAPTSAQPPTWSGPRTTARPGHSRPHQPTRWISPGSHVPLPRIALRWATRATSGLGPRSWGQRPAGCRGRRRARHRERVAWARFRAPAPPNASPSVSTRCWPRSTREMPGLHRPFPPASMASMPFRVPRPPTARPWDSASSEAPSSSAP